MINVGVIGLGMGQNHLAGYSKLKDARLKALCDIDKERLDNFAKMYNVPGTFQDYHEMLKMKELDAVSICLPNYLHCPVTLEALEAGKSVLVEKPMATNSGEAEKMLTAARNKKKALIIGMNYRFKHQFQYLKKLITEGELGEVYYIKSRALRRKTFTGDCAYRLKETPWFTQKEKSGGGALIDMGPHMIDLALWLTDNYNPVTVFGSVYTKLGNYQVDDLASALIKLDNGTTISVEISWETFTKDKFSLTVFGTKAGVITDPFTIYKEVIGSSAEITPKLNPPPEPAYEMHQEYAEFIETIKNGKRLTSSAEKGLIIMKILDAIYESANTGKAITI